jgi:hypothetical protein
MGGRKSDGSCVLCLVHGRDSLIQKRSSKNSTAWESVRSWKRRQTYGVWRHSIPNKILRIKLEVKWCRTYHVAIMPRSGVMLWRYARSLNYRPWWWWSRGQRNLPFSSHTRYVEALTAQGGYKRTYREINKKDDLSSACCRGSKDPCQEQACLALQKDYQVSWNLTVWLMTAARLGYSIWALQQSVLLECKHHHDCSFSASVSICGIPLQWHSPVNK